MKKQKNLNSLSLVEQPIKSKFNRKSLIEEKEEEENEITYDDFLNLPLGTLIRYKCFFEIEQDKTKKEVLAKTIFEHFNKFTIDEENVIKTFIKLEKDNTMLNQNSGTRRSMRNMDKPDKTTPIIMTGR